MPKNVHEQLGKKRCPVWFAAGGFRPFFVTLITHKYYTANIQYEATAKKPVETVCKKQQVRNPGKDIMRKHYNKLLYFTG